MEWGLFHHSAHDYQTTDKLWFISRIHPTKFELWSKIEGKAIGHFSTLKEAQDKAEEKSKEIESLAKLTSNWKSTLVEKD